MPFLSPNQQHQTTEGNHEGIQRADGALPQTSYHFQYFVNPFTKLNPSLATCPNDSLCGQLEHVLWPEAAIPNTPEIQKFLPQPCSSRWRRQNSSPVQSVYHHTTKPTQHRHGKPDCRMPSAECSRHPATEEQNSTTYRRDDHRAAVEKPRCHTENFLRQCCRCGLQLPSFRLLQTYLHQYTTVDRRRPLQLCYLYLILQNTNWYNVVCTYDVVR